MSENEQRGDTDRVGISDESRLLLDEMMADGFFKDAVDAYRLAAAQAIAKNIDIGTHSVKREGHMYLISQVDPDHVFGEVISARFPKYGRNRYRALEKFADVGMRLLKEHIEKNGALDFWKTE